MGKEVKNTFEKKIQNSKNRNIKSKAPVGSLRKGSRIIRGNLEQSR
jgi:hypothetical protein